MKILVTGDWQLTDRPACDRLDASGRSIRFQENIETIRDMIDSASDLGCEKMVHLGDLSEEMNPSSAVMAAAADLFRHAIQKLGPISAIAGNHDGRIFSLSSSSLEPLAKMIGNPADFQVFHDLGYAANCVFLPYLHQATPAQIGERLRDLFGKVKGKPAFLFGHYSYSGCTIGAKNIVLPGDQLGDAEIFQHPWKAVLFGHIHKQQIVKGPRGQVAFPGSPYAVDFGERLDTKGYAILDTDTAEVSLQVLPARRAWVQIDVSQWAEDEPIVPANFEAAHIVKFVGTVEASNRVEDRIRAYYKKNRFAEPFYKVFDIKRHSQGRASRGQDLSEAGGLREAAAAFVAKTWGNDPEAAEALIEVMDLVKEQKVGVLSRDLLPVKLMMKNWMTYVDFDYAFLHGSPVLITGPNGTGKTNFLEAFLFCLTGQTSKPLNLGSLISQGRKSAEVALILSGEKGVYRVRRTLTRSASGSVSQKVFVESSPHADDSGYIWTNLADGGVRETQAILRSLVGASYLSLKATTFQFQREASPIIDSDPAERRSILGDILGLDPLLKAYEVINAKRLSQESSVKAAESALEALQGFISPEAGKEAKQRLSEATKAFQEATTWRVDAEALLKPAEVALEKAQQAAKAEAVAVAGIPDHADSLAADEKALATAIESHKAEQERRRAEVVRVRASIARLNVETERITTLVKDLSQAKTAVEAAEKVLARLREEAEARTAALATATAEAAAKFKALAEKRQALQDLSAKDIGTCSRCGQAIDSAHVLAEAASLEAEIAALASDATEARKAEEIARERLRTTKTAIEKEAEVVKGLQAREAAVAEQVTKAQAAGVACAEAEATETRLIAEGQAANVSHAENEKRLRDAVRARKEWKACVDAERAKRLETLKTMEDEVASRKQSVETLTENLESAKTAENKARVKMTEYETQVENWEAHQRAIQEKANLVAGLRKELAKTQKSTTILNPKSGLPVYLIDSKLPALAARTNQYLERFGSTGLAIEFTTQTESGKDTLEILVDNGVEPRLDIAAYSGGQLQRIEMCLKQALADVANDIRDVRIGFIALDEPGVHLDDEFKARLLEILHEKTATGKIPVAVVISHDRKLVAGFGHRIEMMVGPDGESAPCVV